MNYLQLSPAQASNNPVFGFYRSQTNISRSCPIKPFYNLGFTITGDLETEALVNNEDKRFVKYLTWRPGAFGSTPESKIASTVPRPSYCGYLLRKEIAAVSRLGSRSWRGNALSQNTAILVTWREFPRPNRTETERRGLRLKTDSRKGRIATW